MNGLMPVKPGIVTASILFLAACGGGGGGSSIDLPDPPSEFTIGGTVSGLAGDVVVLRNDGGDDLSVSQNGGFTFDTAMTDDDLYIVTVFGHPDGQTCTVSGGIGNVNGVDVTDILVDCITDPVVSPEGELIGCFNPDLFVTGTTWTASYRVRRYEPVDLFYDVTLGITETHEVIGAASFNGEDDAVQIRVSSVGEDIGIPPGGFVALTDEPEDFTGEFMAYYTVDSVTGEVRYLGAERDYGEGDGYESWEIADPHERLVFDLEPEESVGQTFTLTTDGVARDKETLWVYDGQADINGPEGSIGSMDDACKVSGTGHEPSLFAQTADDSPFEIFFAPGTGVPVNIRYLQDNSDAGFPDVVMDMWLIEAGIDGMPVH